MHLIRLTTRLVVLVGFVFTAPLGAADKPHHPKPKIHQTAISKFYAEMEKGMNKMMVDMHRAPATGNPDVDFMAMMIPHHEGAVEMARLVLIHGQDPLVRRLAEEIIASQQVEIDSMKRRLSVIKKSDNNATAFPFLGSTRGVNPGQ